MIKLSTNLRIILQDCLWRLPKIVHDGDKQHVEQLQESLHSEFAVLEAIGNTIPDISGIVLCPPLDITDAAFNDLDDDIPNSDIIVSKD